MGTEFLTAQDQAAGLVKTERAARVHQQPAVATLDEDVAVCEFDIVFSHGHLSVICYADDGRVSTRLCCCNPPP